MNTYHPDRATAIQFEIVKPIEDWVIPAAGIPRVRHRRDCRRSY